MARCFGVTGSSGAVVVFGMRGNVFRSDNGGKSWQKVETGVSVGLTGATITKDGRLVLVSQGGDVLVSKDGGLSFQAVKVEKALPATAVAAFEARTPSCWQDLAVWRFSRLNKTTE